MEAPERNGAVRYCLAFRVLSTAVFRSFSSASDKRGTAVKTSLVSSMIVVATAMVVNRLWDARKMNNNYEFVPTTRLLTKSLFLLSCLLFYFSRQFPVQNIARRSSLEDLLFTPKFNIIGVIFKKMSTSTTSEYAPNINRDQNVTISFNSTTYSFSVFNNKKYYTPNNHVPQCCCTTTYKTCTII